MLRATFEIILSLFKNLLLYRKTISDADNLLLWYSCCKQLGISNLDLQNLVGIQSHLKFEIEHGEIRNPKKKEPLFQKSVFTILKNMIENDFNSMLEFFSLKK